MSVLLYTAKATVGPEYIQEIEEREETVARRRQKCCKEALICVKMIVEHFSKVASLIRVDPRRVSLVIAPSIFHYIGPPGCLDKNMQCYVDRCCFETAFCLLQSSSSSQLQRGDDLRKEALVGVELGHVPHHDTTEA